jgi:hypothetical protein
LKLNRSNRKLEKMIRIFEPKEAKENCVMKSFIICIVAVYIVYDQIKDDKMAVMYICR